MPTLAANADLDGDGQLERIVAAGETVQIGNATIPCGGDSFPCEVNVVDCSSGDTNKEVAICEIGPRDDRSCRLYSYDGSTAHQIILQTNQDSFWASDFVCHGNSIILADQQFRIYTRRNKFVLNTDLTTATHYPQPFYFVDYSLTVDRTFPIKTSPNSGKTVANVRAGSQITVLLESSEDSGWYLVHISSGLTGWATMETLTNASNQLMAIMSAG